MAVAEPRAGRGALCALLCLVLTLTLGPSIGRAAPPASTPEPTAESTADSRPAKSKRARAKRRTRDALREVFDPNATVQQSTRERLVWRPTSVAWPLSPLTEPDPDPVNWGLPEVALGGAVRETEPGPGVTLRPRAELQPLLEQRAAMVEGYMAAPSLRGSVRIGEDEAVNVWIASLETVRVRRLSGEGALRFVRIIDAHTAVIEAGRSLAPGLGGELRYELSQPPADGAVWSIEADGPAEVIVERAVERTPRYSAVEVEDMLLRWILDGRSLDTMPRVLEPDDSLEAGLRLEAELGRELLELDRSQGGRDTHLEKAVVAWRQLAAMQGVDRQRLPVRPYFVGRRGKVSAVRLAKTSARPLDTDDSRNYRLAELEAQGSRSWDLARRGGAAGVLYVDGRAWAAEGEELRDAELRVLAGGRVIARMPLSRRPARHSVDPDTAFPRFEELVDGKGRPVGEFATMAVPLAPGRGTYTLELVGGPALLAVREGLRVESTVSTSKGSTPRKRSRAAHRHLGKSESPAAPWLAALLAEKEHEPVDFDAAAEEFEALGERSPALALAILVALAEDPNLDERQARALGERAAEWLAALAGDPDFDARARGQLRSRWITIAAIHGDRRLARLLVDAGLGEGADPIHELPLEGLRLLAELLAPAQGTVRSPALALLELARRRAPTDEQIRGQLLYLWKEYTRWSKRRPIPEVDGALIPRGEWLIPRRGLPGVHDGGEREQTWLRLIPGRPEQVFATLGGGIVTRDLETEAIRDPRRMRLLDVYVASPLERVEPVRLRVDERAWWSPQLQSVVRHRIAVPPGPHELQLDGPLGTIAWAELPPDEPLDGFDPEKLGRRERMHDLSKVSWILPGPQVPGYARLELRWPDDMEARSAVIHIHQDGVEQVQTVLFDPRTRVAPGSPTQEAIWALEIDPEATPLGASPATGFRHEVVFAIAAKTRRVWFEVEGKVSLAAGLSLRRALRPRELVGDDGALIPVEIIGEDELLSEVFAELTTMDGQALLDELARLSQLLLVSPDSVDERARRAALLLMLGETGFARADLIRISAWADREDLSLARRERARGLLLELEDNFSALIDPREIIVSDAEFAREAILVEPAIAALVGDRRELLDPWLELWSNGRQENPSEALARLARERRRRSAAHGEPAAPELGAAGDGGPNAEGDGEGESGPAAVDDEQVAALLPELTRATWLSVEQGRSRAAARLWLELYGHMVGALGEAREPLAVGLAAVPVLLEHLNDPNSDARDAGLAFGLARELEPRYGHTSVRSLAFVAALRSDWSRVHHSENSAGFERLELPVAEIEPTTTAKVREALLAAPFTEAEARETLRPGRKGILAWDADAGAVDVQLWCRATRPDLDPSRAPQADNPRELGRARLSLGLRSGDAGEPLRRRVEVGDGELVTVTLPVDSSRRHRLEVVLAEDPIWLCAWRSVGRAGAKATRVERDDGLVVDGDQPEVSEFYRGGAREDIEARRRARWWTAEDGKFVEFVVLGPTSLNIEARAIGAGEGTAAVVEVEVEGVRPEPGAPGAGRGGLALSPRVERTVITERRRRFAVTEAVSHTLLLTEVGPHRVRLRTRTGRALLRARLRRDHPLDAPPAHVELGELLGEGAEPESVLSWRGVGPGLAIAAADPHDPLRNHVGSFDGRLRVGLDDLGDVDDLRPRLGSMVTAGWRRELLEDRLWIYAAAQTALRNTSPISAGVRVRLSGRVPRAGVRLGAELDTLAGPWYTGLEGSIRGEGFIDRPIWLSPYLQLRPGVNLGIRWQSLNRGGADIAGENFEPHPRVFQTYVQNHPLVVEPELELRAYPLQDLAVFTEASLVANSDLGSLDRVDLDLGAEGIARRPSPWVPTWGLAYQASMRLADAHRSSFFLRHRVGGRLGMAVWARDAVRVSFGVADRLYLIAGSRPRNVFELWLRVDGVFGRRMRDYGPGELWFSEPWAPRAWGDHEHQADSTLAPVRGEVRSQASR